MAHHAKSSVERAPMNRMVVVACLLAVALVATSQVGPLGQYAAVLWGLALVMLLGALVAAWRLGSPRRPQ